jgi:heme-degrading monooxygenase HmoA
VYARLHSFVLGDQDRPAADAVVEQVLPLVRDIEGYRGMVVLAELAGGRIVSVSLWDSTETMDSSRKVAEKIRDAETSSRQVENMESSTYRVVAFDLSD